MAGIRHGYTNATRIAGERVVKRYLGTDAAERMRAEVDAIHRTAGRVPAPEVVHIDGADCVVTYRSLHADSQPPTWTHGDYGPQNLLYDSATLEVTAVLDWEFARLGDPVDDLAWAEWIVRMHHAGAAASLGHLFQGWGEQPEWERRQAAMLAACHRFRDRAERLRDRPAAALWAVRAGITAGWHR